MFTAKEVKRILYMLDAKFFTTHCQEDDSDSVSLNLSVGEYDLYFNLSSGNRYIYFEGESIVGPNIWGLFDQILAEEVHHRVSQGQNHLTIWLDYEVHA